MKTSATVLDPQLAWALWHGLTEIESSPLGLL